MHGLNLILVAVYYIIVVVAMVHVIMDNRQPAKTMAWALVIWFVPVVGIVFYIFFGVNTRKERLINQRQLDQLTKRSMLGFFEQQDLHLPEQHKPLIDLFISESFSLPFKDSHAEFLTDGYQFFPRLLRDIAAARHHIHIDMYIIEDDPLGRLVSDALIAKVRSGVEVRIIYDDVGCWNVKNPFFERLREEGIEVAPFLPVRFPSFTSKVNYRNHRKVVVIDGKIGYTGGMNINDHYFKKWRDTHLRITGNAVASLQYTFLDSWLTGQGSIDRPMAEYYPMVTAGQHIASVTTGQPASPSRGVHKTLRNKLVQLVPDEPDLPYPILQYSYEWAIHHARTYIYFQTPYFVPPEPVLNALKSAAMSGVDVRLMIPEVADNILMRPANRAYYDEILRAGVRLFLKQGEFIHSKTFVCDDYLSSIGSANMDARSFDLNYEINSYIYDEETALLNRRIFMSDLEECRELTLAEWSRRPWYARLIQSVIRLFAPLL